MSYSFRTRKEPRLNLRFESHDILDEFELAAHKHGMGLSQWIKSVMADKLRLEKSARTQSELKLESILILRKLAENKTPEEDVASTKSYVKDYISKIKSHASGRH